MKFYKTFIFCLVLGMLVAGPVLAADPYGLEATANAAKLNTGLVSKGIPAIVGYIISVFLSLLGILFFVLMVYGGYIWMTSYGDEKKVTRAKELIVSAVIGLVIIIAAYAISSFVITKLAG